MRDRLKAWLESHAPEFEQDDPPAPCKLTDLSLGGCYLETGFTFSAAHSHHPLHEGCRRQLRAEGVVLVMHPDLGMGVEFTQTTDPQRDDLEKIHPRPDQQQWRSSRAPGGTGRSGDGRTGSRRLHLQRVQKIRCSTSSEKRATSLPKPSRSNCANSAAPKPQPTKRRSNSAQAMIASSLKHAACEEPDLGVRNCEQLLAISAGGLLISC